MRASFAILALAAVVSAGSISKRQLPDCAMACIVSADTGSCDQTDNTCMCKSSAFVDSTYSCIASTCSGADLDTAVAGAKALCAAAGVDLTQTVPAATESPSASAAEPTETPEPTGTEPAPSASATGSVSSVSQTSVTSRVSNISTAAASGSVSRSAGASPTATAGANGALSLASSPMLGAFAAVAGLVFAL